MTNDATEPIRRQLVAEINAEPGSREFLEQKHGQVWDTRELQEEFDVLGFMAPYVIAQRRTDGMKGTIMFQHSPRFYFDWSPE